MPGLSSNLTKHAAMNEQVCRIKITQLHLATQHRWHFVTVTLTISQLLAADNEVANQLWHKPLISVVRLLHEALELLRRLSSLRETRRSDIKPKDASISISEKQISEGAHYDNLNVVADQPPPITQESVAPVRVETDGQLVPSDAHVWWRMMTANDPKLSDGGGWRAGCTVGGKAAAEAASVTAGAVRCSAWLGVAVIWDLAQCDVESEL
jgi:hypothetical protein